jgi:copper ion binding protein
VPCFRRQEEEVTTTTFHVQGMSCAHCVNAVSEELGRLEGVRTVDVDLTSGAVTVASDAPLDEAVVGAAVDEAGYELVLS